MTASVYESTTVTDFGSDATSHVANYPATVNANDLLLYLVAMDAATTTITTPSGLSLLIDNSNVSARDPAVGIYGKVAAGTEGGTTVNFVTSNVQRGSVHIIRISAWSGSLPGVICMLSTSNSSISPAGLALGAIARDILWVVAQLKSSTTAFGTVPSGYSNENKTGVGEDTTASAAIASATKTATASNEMPAALWNNVNALNWYSCLIAILPTFVVVG